jgi:hypothetical protein
MAFPTTNAVTELPAINQILASCGQAPVTTLDSTNPDVAIAYDTLLEVSREVQTEGWSFNKENHYPFEPNNDNEIVIPSNVLQIDLTNNGTNGSKDSIIRNGKLYDKQNHKDNDWTDTVECDVIWFFDWVDLPGPIKDYITARAATVTSSRIVGDQNQYAMLQQKEAYMRAMALEYECNQGDYSYFGKPDNSEPYVSYEPYKALMR